MILEASAKEQNSTLKKEADEVKLHSKRVKFTFQARTEIVKFLDITDKEFNKGAECALVSSVV